MLNDLGEPDANPWRGVIQARMANTYTLCAAIWRLFMQIQGDLNFLVAWFTVARGSPETPAVTPLALTARLNRHVGGYEYNEAQVFHL